LTTDDTYYDVFQLSILQNSEYKKQRLF